MNHEEYDNLTALYALGALDGNDRSLLEAHLPGCAECRKAVQEYSESATGVAFSAPAGRPSAAVKDRILAEVRKTGAAPAPTFRSPWMSVAAGILIAILGFNWYRSEKKAENLEAEIELTRSMTKKTADIQMELDRRRTELVLKLQKEREEALRELEKFKDAQVAWMKGNEKAPNAVGFVEYKGSNLRVSVKGMPELPAGKVYELWAFVDGKPQRAGEFTPDKNGVLVATYDKSPAGKIGGFAMSIEVTGGVDSPTDVAMLPF